MLLGNVIGLLCGDFNGASDCVCSVFGLISTSLQHFNGILYHNYEYLCGSGAICVKYA